MFDKVKTLLKEGCNEIFEHPLHKAASKGDLKDLKRWLSTIDIESKYLGDTPLFRAISGNKLECMIYLLEKGANPNSVSRFLGRDMPIAKICFEYFDDNILKLLAMYGIEKDKLLLQSDTEDENEEEEEIESIKLKEKLLNTILLKKEELDKLVLEADGCKRQEKYAEACSAYRKAGEIWLSLYKDEKEPVFRRHYQQKALTLYEKTVECYQAHLNSKIMTSEHYDFYANCLDQVIKLCKQLKEDKKVSQYIFLLSQLEQNQKGLTSSASSHRPLLH